MTTTTNVKQTKINIMTQSQYNSATKNATELYMVTDAQISYNDLTDTPTIPTVNNATLTITQGGVSKGTFTANASSDVTIALDAGGGSLSGLTDVTLTSPASGQVLEYNGSNWVNANSYNRNIGEIVTSTIPLTDAGLHLLDGALISGSGSYADFVTYIAGLVSTYPDLFETEANWQTAVTTYGVCGKFVYDSVNNTVRLPKITGIIEGTTDVTALGDLVEAGLPNITGEVQPHYSNLRLGTYNGYGNFDTPGTAAWGSGAFGNSTDTGGISFDASRSNSIYGNSNTVQPQTIKILYYIVIATSTKTDIQVDIDEIATDLNGKADADLTNVNDTGYIKMAGAGMPSNTYVDLTLGASGTTYTAPANGWYFIAKSTSGTQYFDIEVYDSNDNLIYIISNTNNNSAIRQLAPVKKGYKIKLDYNASGTLSYFRFIYAQGSESEAS